MAQLVGFSSVTSLRAASSVQLSRTSFRSTSRVRTTVGTVRETRSNAAKSSSAETETSYLVAESATLMMGTLFTAFPRIFISGLVPDDAPAFALQNGDLAVRLAASLLFMLATSMAALADASSKGNLTKSATYRRLNNACFLVCITTMVLAVQAYAASENMNNPILLMALLLYLVPGSVAVCKGAIAQGLQQPAQLLSTVQEDVSQLTKQLTTPASTKVGLFYQLEIVLCLVTGALLLSLPATVMEFPEPNFGAETLMRRIVGGEAALMAVVCSLLLDASERGRLGASTFKALNLAASVSVLLTAFWLASLVTVGSDGGALSASAASANAMSATAPMVLLAFGWPAGIFAYQGFTAQK